MGQRQMKVTPVLLLLGYVAPALGGVLYPFGPQVGDTATPHEDDGMSPEIDLWEPFPFYGHAHRSLYVNNNGVVSFGVGVPEFTPEPFPVPQRPLLAPFWADVDTRFGGDVFYRQSRHPALLARVTRDIGAAVPSPGPPPTWVFVATWDRVTFFGAATKKVNTFQAVLATNGVTSYVMLNYGDISWTTGIANQGDPHTGLGGTPAQAGFNSGDPAHYAVLPGSRSPRVTSVARGSNVGVPGRWIFRVDGDIITPDDDVITPDDDVITPDDDVITPDDDVAGVIPDDVTGVIPDDVTQGTSKPSTEEQVYLCHW